MKVIYRPTGQLGEIPDEKFDPSLFSKVDASAAKQPVQQQGITSKVGNFLLDALFGSTKKAIQAGPQQADLSLQGIGQEVGAAALGPLGQLLLGSQRQKQAARAGAELGSYAVSFGKGAGLLQKVLFPGAVVGGLQELAKEEATPTSVVGGAALGAGGAGALQGLLGLGGKTLQKIGGKAEKIGEAIRGTTRNITVPASIYGAGKEKAINKTLDSLGIRGTAQQQYELLLPKMQDLEQKIQSHSINNPAVVSVKELKNSFIDKLKSSFLSKDLKSSQAQTEIQGFLTDLNKMSGGKGKFTEMSAEKILGWKRLINESYQTIEKKLFSGQPLTPREKVISIAWDAIDDPIKIKYPEIKDLLIKQSHLYSSVPSLSRSRFNPPTFRIAGTSIPGVVTQKGADIIGRGTQKIGQEAGKIGGIEVNPLINYLLGQTGARSISGIGQKPQDANGYPQDQGIEQESAGYLDQIPPPAESIPQGIKITKDQMMQVLLSPGISKGTKDLVMEAYKLQQPKEKTEATITREQTGTLVQNALSALEDNPNIKTGMIGGPLEDIKAKVGLADQPSLDFNITISNLAATIAKQRGGTSFTPNEQKLLEKYSPKVGDSRQQLLTKLRKLQQVSYSLE